jgi:hypothetical protein
MKKIELLYFTVAKNCVSTARHCQAVALFFINCSKLTQGTPSFILLSVEQMTFFCRAVEIPKKSVEQPRFKQLHFEQLTLPNTSVLDLIFCYNLNILQNNIF